MLASPVPLDAMVAMRLNAVVVDLAVLGPQGWTYLDKLCARLPGLGVIVCTGQSSVAQRVRGLRLGADDWVTKPCHPEELIARIEAVVRRRKRADVRVEKGPVVIGEVEIRADQFQAFVSGASVELTRREFELIQLLAEAEGQVLQREEIYQRVWGYAMVHGDRSVDVFVRKLRSKLERVSPGWRYIHTHFGIGYRFSAEPVEAPVAEPSPSAGAPEPRVAARASRPRRPESSPPTNLGSWCSGPLQERTQLRDHPRLAVAVWKVPGGGTAAATISNILTVAFIGGLFFFGYRLYMERRETIFGLEERQRGLLYGALALIVFALVATHRMWDDRARSARSCGSRCSALRAGPCTASGARTRRIDFGTARHTFVTKPRRSVSAAPRGKLRRMPPSSPPARESRPGDGRARRRCSRLCWWSSRSRSRPCWPARRCGRPASPPARPRGPTRSGLTRRPRPARICARGLERGLQVAAVDDGDVRVSVRIPTVIPSVRLGRVSATSHFRPQGDA